MPNSQEAGEGSALSDKETLPAGTQLRVCYDSNTHAGKKNTLPLDRISARKRGRSEGLEDESEARHLKNRRRESF